MPAKDFYHDTVKTALIKDQWLITDDCEALRKQPRKRPALGVPLSLKLGKKDFYVDLGASNLLAAEKEARKIAVEIKSFTGRSDINDLEKALEQYILYHDILTEVEPSRELFLAVPNSVAEDLFEEPVGKLLLRKRRLKLISFAPQQEVIKQWILPN